MTNVFMSADSSKVEAVVYQYANFVLMICIISLTNTMLI